MIPSRFFQFRVKYRPRPCVYGPVVRAVAAKACVFYNPGSNSTRTFNIYLYLNHYSHAIYQRLI